MHDITREQEAAIARLAIDNPTVGVTPQADGTVITEAGGKRLILDPFGNATPEPVERAYLALPIDLLRRMLGDDVIDAALEDVAGAAYPDHALSARIGDDVRARILELLATSESVRERADGEFEAAAIAADEADEEVA
jgi:hypothetical protein